MLILNKKEFNLAFITIGWDYFQVLAFFSTIDVAWPTIVLDFFDVLKFFSFSIDIAAPECLSPNITFEMKWILMMLVPLTVSLIMSIYWVVAYCFKRFIRGIRRRALLHAHTDVVIATLFLMMYYLYLPLCMKVIEIFNCAELNPSDGFEYTSWTSSSCSGGTCSRWPRCSTPRRSRPSPRRASASARRAGFPRILSVRLSYAKTACWWASWVSTEQQAG